MTALIMGAFVAAVAVVVVALPFVRASGEGESETLDTPTEAQHGRLALIEERDHALAGLKELEFDHRTGKIGDEDYRALVGPLRRTAAEALRALDVSQE
jgi:hypothetical protein